MGQAGIPLFYLQHFADVYMKGGAVCRDNFGGTELFWGWREFLGEASEVGKAVVVAGDQVALNIDSTKNGCWDDDNNEGIRILMNPIAFPCEIKIRLDEFSNNDKTQVGLFISKAPVSFGAINWYGICRKRDSAQGKNGICVVETMWINKASNDVLKLPVWLRLRVGSTATSAVSVYFDYSLDNIEWVNMHYESTGWTLFSLAGAGIGVYASNDFATKLAILSKFSKFKMRSQTPD